MSDDKTQKSEGGIELTYKRGFEMGYWLQRGNYEKLDRFIKSAEIHHDFQKGLAGGKKQAQQEFFQSAIDATRKNEMQEINNAIMEGNAENVDPIYKKGFEHGYWLQRGGSKELPGLIDGSKNHAGYSSGLISGKKEADREKIRDKIQSSKENKSKDTGPEIG